jgi:hypothetical protein
MGPNTISGSVGRGGLNRQSDVKIVQVLLNENLPIPYRPLTVNGICDGNTIAVIAAFQRNVLKMLKADGRVDPGGRTFRALAGESSPVPAATTPFMTRINEFRAHVKTEYGINVSVNSDMRDAVWQQRMHVAHMIKYNSFGALKPKSHKVVGGRNLLDFNHLKDPKVTWGGGIGPEEFLRDKNGAVCRRKGDLSGYDPEPDEEKTRARALEILTAGGVATAKDRATELHSAMVAPGVQGCSEPCACGGNRSRHLAGMAVDLNRDALNKLRLKLVPATDAQLDKLLAEFHLRRPMSSEPWHVEGQI